MEIMGTFMCPWLVKCEDNGAASVLITKTSETIVARILSSVTTLQN